MLGKDGKVSESGQRERDAQIYGPIVNAPVELASGGGAVTGDDGGCLVNEDGVVEPELLD